MTVEFQFAKKFTGSAYTKGYYKVSGCKTPGEGVNTLMFTFPLDGCGTTIRSQGGYGDNKVWYHNTVIIMYETYLGILESFDRSFELRCELDDKIKKVSSHVTVPMLASQSVGFKFEMPKIWMKLVAGKDPSAPPAPYLTIGEIGTMVVVMENQSNRYDFYAFQCSAHDGSGKSQVIMLNDLGCPIHRKLVGPQQFDKLRSHEMISFAHFKVFKFPDVENVYIECFVKLCFQQCPKEKCWIIKGHRERFRRHIYSYNDTNKNAWTNNSIEVKTYQSVNVIFPKSSESNFKAKHFLSQSLEPDPGNSKQEQEQEL
ncbi:unnamed protein product [Gordionus sp. m RMFG-2023]|uniref:cuticlin-1-like n=1 Tax=Gordionus sp. m RMFG-2023 TaxID=3053472 RepID=UPI0030E43AFE